MKKKLKIIVWFHEVDKHDIPLVGGKGANLGEMTRAGIPVPPGFVVTAESYYYFLEQSGLEKEIGQLLSFLETDDSHDLQSAASTIKNRICEAAMPPEISSQIREAYLKLGGGFVAVRSSATAEDLPEASFAGQQSTYLNIQGEDAVVSAVQSCWASLFEARAIFYRQQQGFDHLKVGVAVPVQRMVQSESSGVMFTLEPVTGDASKVVIEAVYGLGEAIVSGEVTPDLYVLDKKSLTILDKKIAEQDWQLARNPLFHGDHDKANVKLIIPDGDKNRQKLADDQILALAEIGKHIESHYNFPQDIEWAREGATFYIVQTRPVTTITAQADVAVPPAVTGKVLLSGSPASPGVGSGPVKVIKGASEIGRVKKGDILVAEMTTPDFVPAMKRAAAIVTDRGGRTCHAAIVSRELGIPCVVGTGSGTHVLTTGQIVSVDGSQGKIFEGKVASFELHAPRARSRGVMKTATRLYVNLAEPELAEKVAARDVDGVGLLRAEFMAAQIGEHPRYMLKQNRGAEFTDKLTEGLITFAKAFHPRPVVYRTTDFKTNEYRNLKGGKEFEELEENPMLGYRGCSRYIRDIESFRLELDAIKLVREKYDNLWVMIPFVRTVKELVQTTKLMEAEGLKRHDSFKLWMMVEIPSNVLLLDKFIDVGIDGISIGSNDLTQLTLGIDRDNPVLAEEFDERDEAVMMSLEQAVTTAARRGITASICGQAPSFYPELTEKLVEWGITSVSVSPDVIDKTREIIANAERKLGRKSL